MSLTDWHTWIPVIASVVPGILFTVILRVLDRTERIPVFYHRTTSIVASADKYSEDIEIYYKGKPVPQVSVTRLGFANIGKGPITKGEVRKPIRLSFGHEVSILRKPKVLKRSRQDIDFAVVREGDTVKLSFDHLDYMDGAVVEVIHTGDEHAKPQVQGTIRGVRKGIKQISHRYAETRRRKWLLIFAALSLCTLAYALVTLIPAFKSDISHGRLSIWATLLAICLVLPFLVLLIQSLVDWRRTLPRSLSLDD